MKNLIALLLSCCSQGNKRRVLTYPTGGFGELSVDLLIMDNLPLVRYLSRAAAGRRSVTQKHRYPLAYLIQEIAHLGAGPDKHFSLLLVSRLAAVSR